MLFLFVLTIPLMARAEDQPTCEKCLKNDDIEITTTNKATISMFALRSLAAKFEKANDTDKIVLEIDKHDPSRISVKIVDQHGNGVEHQDGPWLFRNGVEHQDGPWL